MKKIVLNSIWWLSIFLIIFGVILVIIIWLVSPFDLDLDNNFYNFLKDLFYESYVGWIVLFGSFIIGMIGTNITYNMSYKYHIPLYLPLFNSDNKSKVTSDNYDSNVDINKENTNNGK